MDLGPTPSEAAPQTKPTKGSSHGFMCQGLWVEFPFEPYDVQREYMSQVILALQQGKNALLESPTGTGKTLCLICATLAWRESLMVGPTQSFQCLPTAAPALTPSATIMVEETKKQIAAVVAANSSSRSQAQGGSRGGSGSSSLQPSSASDPKQAGSQVDSVPQAARLSLPQVIYASRTHGQLAQVVRELRNTSYKDRIRSSVLSSRQQSCLNPAVNKLPGAACNTACKALVAGKKCSWYNNLRCGARGAGSSMAQWAEKVGSVPDIEELLTVGRSHNVCPFYLGRELSKETDVLFMPYNYLLDSNTRGALADSVRWTNAVVIFDEAHNVEASVCTTSDRDAVWCV
ncbi:MAG: hypothetical protein WDW38_005032 [Sanguina aurantia]